MFLTHGFYYLEYEGWWESIHHKNYFLFLPARQDSILYFNRFGIIHFVTLFHSDLLYTNKFVVCYTRVNNVRKHSSIANYNTPPFCVRKHLTFFCNKIICFVVRFVKYWMDCNVKKSSLYPQFRKKTISEDLFFLLCVFVVLYVFWFTLLCH